MFEIKLKLQEMGRCIHAFLFKHLCLFLFATGLLGKILHEDPLNEAVHYPQLTKVVKIILERCDENQACTDLNDTK